ncbi:MAG: hypothetical protein WBV82_09735, partial [Myxococcaceae bacterium]
MACLLAAAGAVQSESDGDVEVFIQHSDADGDSEPVEIFIQHSEQAPPASPPPRAVETLPAPAQEPGPVPVEASARTSTPRAFVATGGDPTAESFVDALGQASVQVIDRVDQRDAPVGDAATMSATARVGVDIWRITSQSVGQPQNPVGGGVRVGELVFGRTGQPFRGAPAAVSAFSLLGTARVELNGRVVAEDAPLQVFALTTGVHADDDTHRRMRNARAGDLELLVLLPQLPRDVSPNGFLMLVYEDVEIEVQSHSVPSARYVPTVSPLNPEDIGNDPFGLRAPEFREAARSPAAGDLVPLLPVALIATPRPLNSAPAQTLIQGVDVEQNGPAPLIGGAVDPSSPAGSLPQGIAALQGSPRPLIGGAVDPSYPAGTLPLGIAPLNTQPLAFGQAQAGALPTLVPPASGT